MCGAGPRAAETDHAPAGSQAVGGGGQDQGPRDPAIPERAEVRLLLKPLDLGAGPWKSLTIHCLGTAAGSAAFERPAPSMSGSQSKTA